MSNPYPRYAQYQRRFGLVCKWIPSKGYGFIRVPGETVDIYVHTTDILPPERNNLKIGETVSFYVHTNKKTGRCKAIQVRGNFSGFNVDEEKGFTGVARQSPFPTKNIHPKGTRFQLTPMSTTLPQGDGPALLTPRRRENETGTYAAEPPMMNPAAVMQHCQQSVAKLTAAAAEAEEFFPQAAKKESVQITVKPEEARLWETFKQMKLMVENHVVNHTQPPTAQNDDSPQVLTQIPNHHFRSEESMMQPPFARVTSNESVFNDWNLRSTLGLMYGDQTPFNGQPIPTGNLMGVYPHLRYSSTSDVGSTLIPNPTGLDMSTMPPPLSRASFEWSVRQSC